MKKVILFLLFLTIALSCKAENEVVNDKKLSFGKTPSDVYVENMSKAEYFSDSVVIVTYENYYYGYMFEDNICTQIYIVINKTDNKSVSLAESFLKNNTLAVTNDGDYIGKSNEYDYDAMYFSNENEKVLVFTLQN